MFNINFKTNYRIAAALLLNKVVPFTIENSAVLTTIKRKYRNLNEELLLSTLKAYNDPKYNKMFKDIYKTRLFEETYAKTKKNLVTVTKEYLENFDTVKDYFHNTLKIKPNLTINAYIVSPDLRTGLAYYNDDNSIILGHKNGNLIKNYNTTYLVHEAMHCLYPYLNEPPRNTFTTGDVNLTHALIELVSDNELFTKLDSQNRYMNNEKLLGHSFTREHKKVIMPYWFKFLGLSREEQLKRVNLPDVNLDAKINMEVENFDQLFNYLHKNIKTIKKDYDLFNENKNTKTA